MLQHFIFSFFNSPQDWSVLYRITELQTRRIFDTLINAKVYASSYSCKIKDIPDTRLRQLPNISKTLIMPIVTYNLFGDTRAGKILPGKAFRDFSAVWRSSISLGDFEKIAIAKQGNVAHTISYRRFGRHRLCVSVYPWLRINVYRYLCERLWLCRSYRTIDMAPLAVAFFCGYVRPHLWEVGDS